jgi:hypothetical protein
MKIYRLIPAAPYDDPNWELSPPQGEVVVRALTSGDARQVAVEAEADFLDVAAKPAQGVSSSGASAFRNEKRYTVIEMPAGQFSQEGPRGVLSGCIRTDVILPLQRKSDPQR